MIPFSHSVLRSAVPFQVVLRAMSGKRAGIPCGDRGVDVSPEFCLRTQVRGLPGRACLRPKGWWPDRRAPDISNLLCSWAPDSRERRSQILPRGDPPASVCSPLAISQWQSTGFTTNCSAGWKCLLSREQESAPHWVHLLGPHQACLTPLFFCYFRKLSFLLLQNTKSGSTLDFLPPVLLLLAPLTHWPPLWDLSNGTTPLKASPEGSWHISCPHGLVHCMSRVPVSCWSIERMTRSHRLINI